MDAQQKTWLIRGGIGAGACALLTAWLVPNTTPTARPSPLAGMAATAEAQKPTYSAVPDAAIPSWAANVQPATGQVPAVAAHAPAPVVDMAPADSSPAAIEKASADSAQPISVTPPAPPIEAEAPRPAPAAPVASDTYQAKRSAWQAQFQAALQSQGGPG
jgi:hypothetical protein